MEYVKDDFIMVKNFSGTLGKVDEIALRLINSCQYVYMDHMRREYVKDAISFDDNGNVTFKRRYLKS